MFIYIVTHGECEDGPDPILNGNGIKQIKSLKIPQEVNMLASGTGKRFLCVLKIVQSKLPAMRVIYSPFFGGPERLVGKGQIILTNGRLLDRSSEYIGAINGQINMWPLLKSLRNRTLICAGGALMETLGYSGIHKSGHLYEIDPDTRHGKMIA